MGLRPGRLPSPPKALFSPRLVATRFIASSVSAQRCPPEGHVLPREITSLGMWVLLLDEWDTSRKSILWSMTTLRRLAYIGSLSKIALQGEYCQEANTAILR